MYGICPFHLSPFLAVSNAHWKRVDDAQTTNSFQAIVFGDSIGTVPKYNLENRKITSDCRDGNGTVPKHNVKNCDHRFRLLGR